jgi:hypothetical protein
MIHRGLNEMRQALEMIPPEEKKAFVEALHKAPKLVEIESNYERCVSFVCACFRAFAHAPRTKAFSRAEPFVAHAPCSQ